MSNTPPSNDTISNADIEWDENGLPRSKHFGDIYFSVEDGIAESEYVFLNGNNLTQAWNNLQDNQCFRIGETGFGTGLNFLLTWRAWSEYKSKHQTKQNARLHFVSIEKHPLTTQDLTRALSLWPELNAFSEKLIAHYPPQPASGLHRMEFFEEQVTLTLIFDDAKNGLSQLLPTEKPGINVAASHHAFGAERALFNAWFLDGFAPACNPKMWTDELFHTIAKLSDEGCTFATFTAARHVKDALDNSHFSYTKTKGFGRKRDMLVGKKLPEPEKKTEASSPTISHFKDYKRHAQNATQSWHLTESSQPIKHCAVIGGGLAGCHTAFALAQKGIQVSLLEQNASLAQEASGNRQGVVYGKLSLQPSPLNTFVLQSLLYATNFYRDTQSYENAGSCCGVLHLAETPAQRDQFLSVAEHYKNNPGFVRWLSQGETAQACGVTCRHPGLFLPATGWLAPEKLCRHLTAHANITVHSSHRATDLQREQHEWHITCNDDTTLTADAVVIANAHDATHLSQTEYLPLKSIRGQVSHLESNERLGQLSAVICGDGYIAPGTRTAHSTDKLHCVGASFNLGSTEHALTQNDHRGNIDKLRALSPDFDGDTPKLHASQGKVGFRCTTPDYFPIVGPVADFEQMKQRFGFLKKKANAVIDALGAHHPHLYVNVGHGSRGLCYAPLSAALVASLVTGDCLPTYRDTYLHLHPSRFLIRDLMRNKL